MAGDISIIFNGSKPINIAEFLAQLKSKVKRWGDFVVPFRGEYNRLSPLEATWNMNCRALNNAIDDNRKGVIKKYVISAPTGSAKTESLITYCSMLPEQYTVLISTNLTEEADNIANKINKEAWHAYDELRQMSQATNGYYYLPPNDHKIRAYSYHSKISTDDQITIEEVAKHQIIVTTHSFYKNHYSGSDKWSLLGEDRDLLVIDEALETMKEYSVKDASIRRAITVFEVIKKNRKFKNDEEFEKELNLLRDELQLLDNSEEGTNLLCTDATTEHGLALTLFGSVDKYKLFLEILGKINTKDKAIKNWIRNVNLNYVISGSKDKSINERLKKELTATINDLNLMSKIGQVYTTSNQGHKSFHRVTDMMFKKSLVCFDATAEVNDIYSLRAKYYDDVHLVQTHKGVRNYSNVTLYSTIDRTSKEAINNDLVATVLKNIKFGKKTLIVTHKEHEALFKSYAQAHYSEHTIDFAHWGAITGLNNWNDFDTCVIVGLNHKSKSYSQSRVIINTDTEETAFGDKQDILNDSIESSMILAEIIQAMNRIRIRKIIDTEGACLPADIYIILPRRYEVVFKSQILGQMPNIQLKKWEGEFTKSIETPAKFTVLVEFLNKNLAPRETILKKELLKKLGMNKNSFATLQGKTDAKKEAFETNLKKAGIGIKKVREEGRKLVKEYFYKI